MKPLQLATLVVVVFAVGFLAGRVSVPVAAPAPAAPQGAAPSPAPAAPDDEAPQGATITGTVAEVIQVPNYTYLRLNGPGGEAWAAVPTTNTVAPGQSVSVTGGMQMENFTSRTLSRTFASIWFGQLGGGGAPAAGGGALPPGHPTVGGAGAGAAGALEAVKRAEGALPLRVADVFTERQLLAGRAVRVKGAVTKVTSLNGTTYAHLADGSGAKATKDDDLTVLLSAEVKQGEQVTVEGTVALERDLGIGAPYPVVLEGARVVGR